jgi:type III secretory pathway lipoprotein EscJ
VHVRSAKPLGGFASSKVRLLSLALLVCVTGCDGVPIVEDVSQEQAREVVAVLNAEGIHASANRKTGGGGKYSVEVSQKHYVKANDLLHARGLPRPLKATFEELVAQKGFLPRSREMEALSLDHALALQVEEMVSHNPAVVKAKAIVRFNSVPEGGEKGVSVAVQERSPGRVSRDEITEISRRVVPGIRPDQVWFSVHKSEETGGKEIAKGERRVPTAPFLFGIADVSEDDHVALSFTFIGSIIIVAFAGGLVGYWYGLTYSATKPEPESATRMPERIGKTARQGARKDLTEV